MRPPTSKLALLLVPIVLLVGAAPGYAQSSDDEPGGLRPAEPIPPVAPLSPVAPLAPIAPRENTPSAPRGFVPVTVVGDGDDFTLVTLGYQGCHIPCTVFVPPGVHPLILSGRRELVTNVEIPSAPSEIHFQTPSPSLKIAGAIMIPAGLIMAASMWAIGIACDWRNGGGCMAANFTLWPILGTTVFGTGVGLLAAGNRQRTQLQVAPRREARRGGDLRLTGIGLGPLPGGGASTSVGFTF